MERVPLLYGGKPIGELLARSEGTDTCFEAHCRLPGKGLWCLWAVGSGGELRLGVPESGGPDAAFGRRFSQRMTAPLGRLVRGELRSAAAEGACWDTVERPETLFRTAWLCRALAGRKDVLTRTALKRRYIALPFSVEKPFPLPPLFCFARIQTIRGQSCAVFAFDEAEWPQMK